MKDGARVAAIQLEIGSETDWQKNLDAGCLLLEEAAKRKPDIVCLPELFTGLKAVSSIPGPESEQLGRIARRHGMYVVAPYYLREEGGVFNCSVLFDRRGQLCGVYRKVHLWPWEGPVFGVTPGAELPVFALDFGVVGLCICHDHQFPETARSLTLKGAEILFCSTRMPDPFQIPWLEFSRIRALENQLFVVSAGASFNHSSTHIVCPRFVGAVLASAGPGIHIIDGTLDLRWLREQRGGSPLYRIPREVPSEEAAELLRKTESHCFLTERRPECY